MSDAKASAPLGGCETSGQVRTTLGLLPVLALTAGLAHPALADENRPAVLGPIKVEGEGEANPNALKTETGMARLPGDLDEVPQVTNVVSGETMKQQGVTTLEEALRNVPGVTLAIGEGGPPNGDQFRIRGIQAKADKFSDGLRDVGLQTRESFNMESVQVLKGPSSGVFGSGTGGGAINTQSKTAKLGNFGTVGGGIGSGMTFRTTLDVNQQVGETSAVRFNALYHNEDRADRDLIESERFGFAGSLGIGLGTDLEWTLGFYHLNDDRVPDYGIPVVRRPGTIVAEPAPEFGVDRDNFYGFVTDTDETSHNAVTSKLRYRHDETFTFYNDTRVTWHDRFFSASQGSCNDTCSADFFAGNPASVSRGGPGAYDLDGWAVQNIGTVVATFETGDLRHELTGGFDVFREHIDRQSFSYSPSRPTADLLDPSHDAPFLFVAGSARSSNSTDIGVFMADRVWLVDEFSVVGGLRVDYHKANTTNAGVRSDTESTLVNPRVSLIWEPLADHNLYFSWSRASSPQGAYVTGDTVSDVRADLDPERTQSFELGAKISVLDGQLGITAALFHITKDNSFDVDPVSGVIQDSRERAEKQRVKGAEFGITGTILPNWTITGAYTYLDAEILDNGIDGANEGNRVAMVPKHTMSFWTVYDLGLLFENGLRGTLEIGTGVTARSKVFLESTNTAIAPSNVSWDMMMAYDMEPMRLALNIDNLTNRINYDQFWRQRAVPSPGRTYMVSAEFRF